MMRPRVLVLPISILTGITNACEVTFEASIQVVLNGTTQELCDILVEGIGIENNSEGVPFACVQERYAGTMEDTVYGPISLVEAQVSTRAVAERTVGSDRFVPFVYPFRGSILATKYTVWPAFNDTFCGEVSDCNSAKVVPVDVFECVIPPPTPSPTILPPTPTTMVPSQTETTLAPHHSGGGGSAMASRPPTDPPVMSTNKVVTKFPNNRSPTLAPSPAILPTESISTPPSPLIIPEIQSAPSGAFRRLATSVLMTMLVLTVSAMS